VPGRPQTRKPARAPRRLSRSDIAIRRHQVLVNCAFSFCWDAWFAHPVPSPATPPAPGAAGGERGARGRRAVPAAVLAPGNPGRARLAGSVDHAAALVGSMVERAPGPPAASADDIPRGRLRPAPLHPELTTTARIDSPAAARRGSRGGARKRAAYSPGRKAARRPRPLPARSARRSCSRTAC
jgi:hypothetical protein